MAQRLSMVLQVGSQDKNSSRLAAETTLLTALLGNLFQRPEALQIMWWLLCIKITLFLIFDYWASHMVQVVKNPPTNAGDIREMGSNPGSGRSPGGGHGNHSSTFA